MVPRAAAEPPLSPVRQALRLADGGETTIMPGTLCPPRELPGFPCVPPEGCSWVAWGAGAGARSAGGKNRGPVWGSADVKGGAGSWQLRSTRFVAPAASDSGTARIAELSDVELSRA